MALWTLLFGPENVQVIVQSLFLSTAVPDRRQWRVKTANFA
jgi:hypothetical protein